MSKHLLLYSCFLILSFIAGYFVNKVFSKENKLANEIDTQPSYRLFNPNYDVTYEQLLKDGFIDTDDNNLVLSKQVNDTLLIEYLLDYEYKLIHSETWRFNLDTFNISQTLNTLDVMGGRLLTDICSERDSTHNFFVRGTESFLFFDCSLYNKDAYDKGIGPVLYITHFYPAFSPGGIMKNHPIYKQ